jgi:hypothetical protein
MCLTYDFSTNDYKGMYKDPLCSQQLSSRTSKYYKFKQEHNMLVPNKKARDETQQDINRMKKSKSSFSNDNKSSVRYISIVQ